MSKYVIALPLSPLGINDEFPAETWPLHLTVVPTFEIEASLDEVIATIRPALARARPLVVLGENEQLFGPHHNVPVTTVRVTDEVARLHRELVESLAALHPRNLKPAYVGDGYRPHISHTAAASFGPGEVATLRQLAIVDMRRRGAEKSLAVVATIELS